MKPSSYLNELWSADYAVEIPLSDRTPHRRFVRDVIAWSRDHEALDTQTLPEHALPTNAGVSSFDGVRHPITKESRLGYYAFLLALATAIVDMTADRLGLADPIAGLVPIGYVVAGIVLAFEWRKRRKAQTRVRVLIFDEPQVLSSSRLASARPVGFEPGSSELWACAPEGFTEECIAFARAQRIRPLVRRGVAFV